MALPYPLQYDLTKYGVGSKEPSNFVEQYPTGEASGSFSPTGESLLSNQSYLSNIPQALGGASGMAGMAGALGGGGLAAILPYAINLVMNLYGSHLIAKNQRKATNQFIGGMTPPPRSY